MIRFSNKLFASLAAAGAILTGISQGRAQSAMFTNIVDTGNSTYSKFDSFNLNNSGTVAFVGETQSGTRSDAYFSNGGAINLIAGSGGALETLIADNGTIAYNTYAGHDGGLTSGVYAYSQGVSDYLTSYSPGQNSIGGFGGLISSNGIIVVGTTAYNISGGHVVTTSLTSKSSTSAEDINSSGNVALLSTGQSVFDQTLSVSNGNTTTIIDGPGTYNLQSVHINDSGAVAFRNVGGSVYSGSGGTLTTVADTTGQFSQFTNLDFNDEGTVAFSANLRAGGSGIYVREGNSLVTIASTSGGAYSNLSSDINLNDSGTVVFETDQSSGGNTGGSSIFAALNGSATPFQVIEIGQSLFGSTVTDVGTGDLLLNNNNQLGFFYTLADGRSGIAVANLSGGVSAAAPEPGTMKLVLPLSLFTILYAVRRRRTLAGR